MDTLNTPQRAGLAPRLGLLIPCRDEAAVIERKLRNLALVQWPTAELPHRVVVIDDGCQDETADLAARWGERSQATDETRLKVEVLTNTGRPGKASAIATGLAALGDSVDLIVLTDADVILRPEALTALADGFAREPRLGMACGSQEFVVDLADDGTARAQDGGALRAAPGRYDRWTALMRELESRFGRLFSVHGQLLAWRADLGLSPNAGIAADDIDLMRQTRARGRGVIKVAAARFIEVKTPPGPGRIDQEQRRARAYFQVIGLCRLPASSSWLERAHFALYRWLPGAAPLASLCALLAAPLLLWWALGPEAAALLVAVEAAALVSPPGRRGARLLRVIHRARQAQRAGDLDDRWQMPR